jgi:hypothetical protein
MGTPNASQPTDSMDVSTNSARMEVSFRPGSAFRKAVNRAG